MYIWSTMFVFPCPHVNNRPAFAACFLRWSHRSVLWESKLFFKLFICWLHNKYINKLSSRWYFMDNCIKRRITWSYETVYLGFGGGGLYISSFTLNTSTLPSHPVTELFLHFEYYVFEGGGSNRGFGLRVRNQYCPPPLSKNCWIRPSIFIFKLLPLSFTIMGMSRFREIQKEQTNGVRQKGFGSISNYFGPRVLAVNPNPHTKICCHPKGTVFFCNNVQSYTCNKKNKILGHLNTKKTPTTTNKQLKMYRESWPVSFEPATFNSM